MLADTSNARMTVPSRRGRSSVASRGGPGHEQDRDADEEQRRRGRGVAGRAACPAAVCDERHRAEVGLLARRCRRTIAHVRDHEQRDDQQDSTAPRREEGHQRCTARAACGGRACASGRARDRRRSTRRRGRHRRVGSTERSRSSRCVGRRVKPAAEPRVARVDEHLLHRSRSPASRRRRRRAARPHAGPRCGPPPPRGAARAARARAPTPVR